jgi:hypothetical protein
MATAPQKIDPPKKPKGCLSIPSNKPFSIPVPFAADITAITDPSKGPPNDCAIVHSLMLQLMPMLSGFGCILKILKVFDELKKAVGSTPPLANVGDLLNAITDLAECYPPLSVAKWVEMIKAILKMILAYIECLIQGFESIRNFKAGVDLNAEGGTPLLLNTLDCAKGNADTSLAALMDAMGPIQPLLDMISPITSLIGIDLSKLSLSGGGSSGSDPIQPIIDFHDALAEIVDAIP